MNTPTSWWQWELFISYFYSFLGVFAYSIFLNFYSNSPTFAPIIVNKFKLGRLNYLSEVETECRARSGPRFFPYGREGLFFFDGFPLSVFILTILSRNEVDFNLLWIGDTEHGSYFHYFKKNSVITEVDHCGRCLHGLKCFAKTRHSGKRSICFSEQKFIYIQLNMMFR